MGAGLALSEGDLWWICGIAAVAVFFIYLFGCVCFFNSIKFIILTILSVLFRNAQLHCCA
jgi:hypothetical protein